MSRFNSLFEITDRKASEKQHIVPELLFLKKIGITKNHINGPSMLKACDQFVHY